MADKFYPDWVQAHKKKGTTIKKVGSNYYLYKHTSKRVPGKKYPQPVDTYIGVITPEGVIESGKKKLSLTNVVVKEYGFSKALWTLCPQSWKTPLGEDWEDILTIITLKWSPQSYLAKDKEVRKEEDFRCQFGSQMGALNRRIYKEHGVDVSELHKLDCIYLLYLEKETVVSRIDDEQRQLLERLGVNVEI